MDNLLNRNSTSSSALTFENKWLVEHPWLACNVKAIANICGRNSHRNGSNPYSLDSYANFLTRGKIILFYGHLVRFPTNYIPCHSKSQLIQYTNLTEVFLDCCTILTNYSVFFVGCCCWIRHHLQWMRPGLMHLQRNIEQPWTVSYKAVTSLSNLAIISNHGK